MKKIVITGGHLTPALAVIDELQKRGGWKIYFIGRKYVAEGERTSSLESMVIPEKGIRFIPIRAGRLQQKFTKYTLPAFLRIPVGFFQALYHLIRLRPKVILSFGSYVSVPVVFAGWLLRIPIMIHQQTVVPGRADKINALFAKKIAVSWKEALSNFPSTKVVLTGNPIRKEIFKTDNEFWKSLKFEKGLPLILVTGGNQGSHRINVTIERVLEKLLAKNNLFHQVGYLQAFDDFDRLLEKRNRLPERLKSRYRLKKYLTGEEWGTLFNKADLVISRAGINTLAELMALEKPSLLIPIPWLYGNEQMKNAQMLKRIGIAEIIPQEKLTPQSLYQAIEKMASRLSDYRRNAAKAKRLVKLNAASKIADLLDTF